MSTPYPTIKDLTNALRAERDCLDGTEGDDRDGVIDVRLQVQPGRGWSLLTGDSSYDQDHTGYWGASCLSSKDRVCDLRGLARDLIDQVRDMHATSQVD